MTLKSILGLIGFALALVLLGIYAPNGVSVLQMLGLLSFLIIAHELGHFAVAKAVGIRVERFGFGLPFGPTLFEKKFGETVICVHAALLGGYVSFPEEDDTSEIPADAPCRFENKTALQRIAVVLAGVTVNAIMAYLLMILVLAVWGFPSAFKVVGFVPNSSAKAAGVLQGDLLLGIDGQQIMPYQWDKFKDAVVDAQGKNIDVIVLRGKEVKTITMESRHEGLIGVEIEPAVQFVPILKPRDVVLKSHDYLMTTIVLNFDAMGKMIAGKVSPKMLSGPVGIVKQGSEAIAKYGFAEGIFIAAILSMILAVMNLLPIPMLDGGHLLFIVIELLRGGKPLHRRVQERLVKTFFFIMMGLMVLLIVHDVNTHILGNIDAPVLTDDKAKPPTDASAKTASPQKTSAATK